MHKHRESHTEGIINCNISKVSVGIVLSSLGISNSVLDSARLQLAQPSASAAGGRVDSPSIGARGGGPPIRLAWAISAIAATTAQICT